MPLLVALLWGGVLVALSGGNWRRLEQARIWRPGILITLFVVQGLARGRFFWSGSSAWGLLVWALASALLAAAAWRSETRGLRLLAAGTLANLLVVLLNGHMPIPMEVIAPLETASTGSGFYAAASSVTKLFFLSDVLRLDWLGATYYLSAGDVLLGVGAVVFLLESARETVAHMPTRPA